MALPEEIPTQKEEGRKSYAQAASQVTPITIAPPQLMQAAHTVALDDWRPYEDLSDYGKRTAVTRVEVRGQTGGESEGGGGAPGSLPPGVDTIGHIHKPLSYTASSYDINQTLWVGGFRRITQGSR